jgi:hypothetical protein
MIIAGGLIVAMSFLRVYFVVEAGIPCLYFTSFVY